MQNRPDVVFHGSKQRYSKQRFYAKPSSAKASSAFLKLKWRIETMNNRNENRKLNLSGYFLHNIPMTVEGDDFIRQLRGYMNTDRWSLDYKFNGPRTESALSEGLPPRAFDQSLPKRFATGRRLYVNDKLNRVSSAAYTSFASREYDRGFQWGKSLGDHNDNLTLKRTIENLEQQLVANGDVIRNQDLTIREQTKRITVMAIDVRDFDNEQQEQQGRLFDSRNTGYAEGHADGLEKGADIIEKLQQELYGLQGRGPDLADFAEVRHPVVIKIAGRTITVK
jgi:hypothetical protein